MNYYAIRSPKGTISPNTIQPTAFGAKSTFVHTRTDTRKNASFPERWSEAEKAGYEVVQVSVVEASWLEQTTADLERINAELASLRGRLTQYLTNIDKVKEELMNLQIRARRAGRFTRDISRMIRLLEGSDD